MVQCHSTKLRAFGFSHRMSSSSSTTPGGKWLALLNCTSTNVNVIRLRFGETLNRSLPGRNPVGVRGRTFSRYRSADHRTLWSPGARLVWPISMCPVTVRVVYPWGSLSTVHSKLNSVTGAPSNRTESHSGTHTSTTHRNRMAYWFG